MNFLNFSLLVRSFWPPYWIQIIGCLLHWRASVGGGGVLHPLPSFPPFFLAGIPVVIQLGRPCSPVLVHPWQQASSDDFPYDSESEHPLQPPPHRLRDPRRPLSPPRPLQRELRSQEEQ